MLRFARFFLFAVLLLFCVTSCDFNAAENAVNEFDVLIGFPSLSTVVNVQALDASSGEPIEEGVTVTFDGTDADAAVDIYNDPVTEITVNKGFGTFALNPESSPAPTNPTQVTLRAQAEGYNATTTSIQVTQEGSVSRVIRLTPDDPTKAAPGTAGARENVNTTNGETNDQTSGQTGATTSSAVSAAKFGPASASFTIPEGIDLETASGDALQSPVTTDLAVLSNSAAAQSLLPKEAKTDANGTHRQIRGGIRFAVRGTNGAANRFVTSGPDTTTVTADFADLSTRTGDPILTLLNPATGASRTVSLSPSNTGRTETEFLFVDNNVIVRSPNGTATVDRGDEAPQGGFYAVLGVDPSDTCSPGDLTINPNGQSGSVRIQIAGDGFAVGSTASIPSSGSSFTLSGSALYEGDIPDLGSVTLTIRSTDNQTVSPTIDPCAGPSVDLPDPDNTNRIDATLRVEANCPTGERLPISPPFDGYSLAYRLLGTRGPFWTVSREDITINTTDDAKETVTSVEVALSGVVAGGDYNAIGTFGDQTANLLDETGREAITMPEQDGGQKTITDQELREECR